MKKITNILFYSISFLLVFNSCKKTDEIIPTTNNVVFKVEGNFSGNQINLEAGENNYYMFSDYSLPSPFPYTLNSVLKQNNCINCPNSIGIDLGVYTSDTSIFNIDQALVPGNQYSYYFDSLVTNPISDTNKVSVFYIDGSGVKYSTKNVGAQHSTSFFNITNVEEFENNELNQNTKKVTFSLSCRIAASTVLASNDSLNLTGTFAFSYPSP